MARNLLAVRATATATVLVFGATSACSTSPGPTSGSRVNTSGEAGRVHTESAGEAEACTSMLVGTGPLTRTARLELVAPPTASAGVAIEVATTVVVHGGPARVITVPTSSAVVMLRDGSVVGRTSGSGSSLVPLPLMIGARRRAQAVPSSVQLIGCDGALRPGDYDLVAVLGYRLDALNGAPDGRSHPVVGSVFVLVSAPVQITVT